MLACAEKETLVLATIRTSCSRATEPASVVMAGCCEIWLPLEASQLRQSGEQGPEQWTIWARASVAASLGRAEPAEVRYSQGPDGTEDPRSLPQAK